MPVLPDVVFDFVETHLFAEVRFGIEFIGVTDDFLFEALRTIIAFRDRQFFTFHLLDRNAGAGVTFGYQRMFRKTFLTKQLRSQKPVLNVFMRTHAVDLRGVAEDNPDVVQHGGFLDELSVHESLLRPLRMGIDDAQCTISDLPTVRHKDMP